MSPPCFLSYTGSCIVPEIPVADLVFTRPPATSIPLCFAHTVKPALREEALKELFGRKPPAAAALRARPRYRVVLKRWGVG